MFDFYPEVNLSIEELLAKIKAQMSEKRFQHILGVEKAAVALAEKYDVNVHKSSLAALLHDYAKETADDIFLELIEKYNLNPDLKNWGNNIWHGTVGIYKMQEDLGFLAAVEYRDLANSCMPVGQGSWRSLSSQI